MVDHSTGVGLAPSSWAAKNADFEAIRLVMVVALALIVVSACGGVSGFGERDGMETQSDMITDGVLTFEEYAAVIGAAVSCAREKGVTVDGPDLSLDGLSLDYGMEAPESDTSAIGSFDGCYHQHASGVDQLYQGSSELEAARISYATRLGVCLTGNDDPRSRHELNMLMHTSDTSSDAYQACRDKTLDSTHPVVRVDLNSPTVKATLRTLDERAGP